MIIHDNPDKRDRTETPEVGVFLGEQGLNGHVLNDAASLQILTSPEPDEDEEGEEYKEVYDEGSIRHREPDVVDPTENRWRRFRLGLTAAGRQEMADEKEIVANIEKLRLTGNTFVIAVWSFSGQPGSTSFAQALALRLRKRDNGDVFLIEGHPGKITMRQMIKNPGDDSLWDVIKNIPYIKQSNSRWARARLLRHATMLHGVPVLLAPTSPKVQAMISPDHHQQLLDVVRGCCTYVIYDLGEWERDEAIQCIPQWADVGIVMAHPTHVSLSESIIGLSRLVHSSYGRINDQLLKGVRLRTEQASRGKEFEVIPEEEQTQLRQEEVVHPLDRKRIAFVINHTRPPRKGFLDNVNWRQFGKTRKGFLDWILWWRNSEKPRKDDYIDFAKLKQELGEVFAVAILPYEPSLAFQQDDGTMVRNSMPIKYVRAVDTVLGYITSCLVANVKSDSSS